MLNVITDNIDIWTSAQKKKKAVGRGSSKKFEFYGIKKLRELILELAVQGKLVPPDHNDKPASELLSKIKAEKELLIKEKKIKKQKPLPIISMDEMLFELPNNWEWVRLGNLGNIFNGNSISVSKKEALYTNIISGLAFIATKDVDYGWKSFDYNNGITIPKGEEKFKVAHKGAVLMCAEGGSAGKKCGITNQDICFGNKLFAIEAYGNVDSKYLLTNYLTPMFFSQFKEKMSGIIGGISKTNFEHLVIPLPSITEQLRISSKVDELMALCDQLEQEKTEDKAAHQTLVKTLLNTLTNVETAEEFTQNWQRISEYFDILFTTEESIEELKQTILQLAVIGKLVPQDPNDIPASELLKKIASEKEYLIKEKLINKSRNMKPLDELPKPFNLASTWDWTRLGDLCHTVADGPHFSPSYVDSSKGVTFLSARNITKESIDISTAKYVSREDHEKFTKRVKIKKGDILYTKGGTTGVAKVNDLDIEFSVWVHVAVLQTPNDKLFNEYLALALNSRHCYQQSQKYTHGTGNKDLGLTRMINITIPLPPLAEQHRIVTKTEDLIALCNALKVNIKEAKNTQVLLADTIVEQAV